MDEDPELEQVICNALSLQEDYPELYLPPRDKDMNQSLPRIHSEIEKLKSLNDPSRLQDTLVELYSILGIPQEPITRPSFNLRKDQSTPSIVDQDEHQTTRNRIKRMLPEEDTEISKRVEEENEDQVPSTSAQKCRKRTLYNKQQTLFLQKQFDLNPYPDYVSRCCFAQVTGIPEPRIQVWFQNRRARHLSKSSTPKESEIAVSAGVRPFIACEVSPNPKLCKNISTIHQIGPQAQRSKSSGHIS